MIKLIRLDYRLLHGQVVFAWTGYVDASRIIVVDDTTANDELKQSILKLSKPAGVKLNIFTVGQLLEKIDRVESLKENIMLIFGNTSSLREFCEKYKNVKVVNYGGLANKPDAKKYASAIFMTKSEVEDTQKIIDLGINIVVQQTPTQKIESLIL